MYLKAQMRIFPVLFCAVDLFGSAPILNCAGAALNPVKQRYDCCLITYDPAPTGNKTFMCHLAVILGVTVYRSIPAKTISERTREILWVEI